MSHLPRDDADKVPKLIGEDYLLEKLIRCHGRDPRRLSDTVRLDDRRAVPKEAVLLTSLRAFDERNRTRMAMVA